MWRDGLFIKLSTLLPRQYVQIIKAFIDNMLFKVNNTVIQNWRIFRLEFLREACWAQYFIYYLPTISPRQKRPSLLHLQIIQLFWLLERALGRQLGNYRGLLIKSSSDQKHRLINSMRQNQFMWISLIKGRIHPVIISNKEIPWSNTPKYFWAWRWMEPFLGRHNKKKHKRGTGV